MPSGRYIVPAATAAVMLDDGLPAQAQAPLLAIARIQGTPADSTDWSSLIALTRLEAILLGNVAIAVAVIAIAMIGILIAADRARMP